MQIRVVVEYDRETNSFSAICPELPGCASFGDTEQEAFENVKEAIELYLTPDEDFHLHPEAHIFQVAL